MATTDPHTGMGSELYRGDNSVSPIVYTKIAGIKSISGPSFSRETHDVSTMDSAQFREYTGGLSDSGELTFSGNFLPAEATQNQDAGGLMREFQVDSCDSVRPWRLVGPECPGDETPVFEFNGIVTAFSMEFPMDDLMSFSCTIKISGRAILDMESV